MTAAALSACGAASAPRGVPTTQPSSGQVGPTGATTSTAAACTTTSVIQSWSLARRAAAVVAVPVLNFDVAGVAPELRAGAAGMLFLGSAPAPKDLATRVSWHGLFRPLVMADEEGGGIQRLKPLVSDVPWPQDMTRTMTPSQVRAVATRAAEQMRAAGVTVDLAPVLDVDARPGPSADNPDGKRSFSGNAAVVSTYGVAFMRGLRAGGVLPVVKHFPGLGGSVGNTDVTSASTRPQLAPFRAAIAAGAPAVMVANASVAGETAVPATLSHAVISGMLRGQLGFDGLVVTDSLSAGAVKQATTSLPDAVVQSLVAGADLVLFGSTLTAADTRQLSPANVRATYDGIVAAIATAVRSGRLPSSRLDAAVGHVMTATGARLCG